MKVSLITTVLNEADNIEEFLKSVINQTKKPDEFIIVDGGSTDGTYEILKKYARKYKWIKVFQVKGASIGKGRNYAIEKAKNEIIAVTDAGCILDKNWLKEITKPFFKDKNVDVVVGIYKPYYTNDFEYFQGVIVVKEPEKIFKSPSRMSIRSMAFKKLCWKKIGKLPEKYGGDDTFFNIKLIEHGCKFSFTKKAVVYWRMRKNVKSFVKQFYKYAIGDVHYGNVFKLKKILISQFGIVSLLLLSIYLILSSPIFFLKYLFLPIFSFLLGYGIIHSFKTRKLSAVVYIPILFVLKIISYFSGFVYGIIRLKILKKEK